MRVIRGRWRQTSASTYHSVTSRTIKECREKRGSWCSMKIYDKCWIFMLYTQRVLHELYNYIIDLSLIFIINLMSLLVVGFLFPYFNSGALSSPLLIFFFLWRYSPNLGLGLPPWNSPFHFGLLDLRYSVELLGRVISSSQGLYLYTNTEKRTHTNTKHPCLSGIRTHDPSFRASEDSAYLRPFGYRDRLVIPLGPNLFSNALNSFWWDTMRDSHIRRYTVVHLLNGPG
jgi:hypothetical protein